MVSVRKTEVWELVVGVDSSSPPETGLLTRGFGPKEAQGRRTANRWCGTLIEMRAVIFLFAALLVFSARSRAPERPREPSQADHAPVATEATTEVFSDPGAGDLASPPAVSPVESASEAVPIAGDVVPPERISGEQVDFGSLRGTYVQSFCLLTAVISREGETQAVSFLKPQDAAPEVKQLFIETVKKWRFRPATLDGIPVAVHDSFSVNHCPVKRIEGVAQPSIASDEPPAQRPFRR